MVSKTCIFLMLAAVAFAAGAKTPAEHRAAAVKELELLQSKGTDLSGCSALAKSSKAEVESAVSELQAVFDALDLGNECGSEGETVVAVAQAAKDAADEAAADAHLSESEATTAMVHFPKMAVSSITEGAGCAWAFADNSNYTGSVAASTAAVAASEAAAGTAAAAATELEDAHRTAVALQHKCRCKANKAHAEAVAAAAEGRDARNDAYTKAQHMLCVIAGTPTESCSVSPPTVTEPELPADVAGIDTSECLPGWELAMFIDPSEHQFWYADAKWSHTEPWKSSNEGGSEITSAFFKKANEIKVVNVESGAEFELVHNLDQSLSELVNGPATYVDMTKEQWKSVLGGDIAAQNHCNRAGFNVRDDSSWRPVRFGFVMNQENDCHTPDTSWGVGLNTGCNAGAECGCCQNSGSCVNKCTKMQLWIQ